MILSSPGPIVLQAINPFFQASEIDKDILGDIF